MKIIAAALALLLILSGCSNSNSTAPQDDASSASVGGGSGPRAPSMCTQVFYDGEKDSAGLATLPSGDGRLYADMVANLLGHFSEIRVIESPVALYKKGDFDKCAANLYLGSDFYAALSADFLADYVSTKSRVAWLGYGFWNLGDSFTSVFGAKYVDLVEEDPPANSNSDPGFYRDVLYKGEVFPKYGQFSGTGANKDFNCDCEVAKVTITDKTKSTVLAQIRHSVTNDKLPYALQSGTHFWFADLPLDYIYEADRYNVFADVLFDIVNLPPRHAQHLAAIRLEDIHAFVDLTTLDEAISIFASEGVLPHLSMIPLFADPYGELDGTPVPTPVPASTQATFMSHINQYKAQGQAVFLWHGVTHQYANVKNPYSGMSGDDYEFWDYDDNKAWPEDSESFVTNRLNWGRDVFVQMGLNPRIWVTPHYLASALDNQVFGKAFEWNMGRSTYFTTKNGAMADQTQFFPYELYRDVYGARMIPENLGYVSKDPPMNSVATMLANAKRNLVLRDSWASAYYHPFLLEGQNKSATDLQKLVEGLKQMGYTFVNLETCADTQGCLKN